MKQIPLTEGKFAIVDDEDFERLSQWKWIARARNGVGTYAYRRIRTKGRNKIVSMHRELLECSPQELVDHVNGDTLDNRKSNLRKCTTMQNNYNTKISKNNTSGFRGVHFSKFEQRWNARININKKQVRLGSFSSAAEAALAYQAAAKKLHGEFYRPPEGSNPMSEYLRGVEEGKKAMAEKAAQQTLKLAQAIVKGEALPSCENPLLVSESLKVLAESFRSLAGAEPSDSPSHSPAPVLEDDSTKEIT